MVAIVTGAGLGLLDSTMNQLNGVGVLGNGALGQARGASYVNLSTGNLVLQFNDKNLLGSGDDIRHQRTYNSQGAVSDGDNDRWRWLGEKRIRLSGAVNGVTSKVYRTTGDGHEARYDWVGFNYSSSVGTGADDRIIRSGSEWIWTEGSSKTIERYDANTGWIKSRVDASGNGFTYTFSGNRLTRIQDIRSGQVLELIYTNNRLSRVDTRPSATGTATQQVHYAYDSNGRLTTVTTDLTLDNSINDNEVYTTRYSYIGSSSRVSDIRQSDGTLVSFGYVEAQPGVFKVSSVADQTGFTTFRYLSDHTEVKDGEGNISKYFYDNQNRLVKVVSAPVNGTSQIIEYQYDSKDNVIQASDGQGSLIKYNYDASSNLIKQTDALGNVIEWLYSNNRVANKTHYIDGVAHTERYVYDNEGNLRYTVSAEGRVSEHTYQVNGLLLRSVDYTHSIYDVSTLNHTIKLSLNQLANWSAGQSSVDKQMTEYVYGHLGQMTDKYTFADIDNDGNGIYNNSAQRTSYVYSAYGELLQTIDRNNQTLESRVYDGLGRLISVVDNKGTTTTSYSAGRIEATNSESGASLVSIFNSRGQLTSTIQSGDNQNRTTRYYYDSAGRLEMTRDADDGRNYILYDDAGRVHYTASPEGVLTGYTYNANGQVIETRQYVNKVDTSSWFNGFSVNNISVSVATHNDDRIARNAYDKNGRLISTTEEFGNNDRVTLFTYDSESKLTSKTTGGDRTTRYFYDKDGLLIGTLNAENYFVENIYDKAGRLLAVVRYGVKSSTTASFHSIKASVGSGEQLSTHYYYDAAGRQIASLDEKGFLARTIYDIDARIQHNYRYTKATTTFIGESLSAVISRAGNALQTDIHVDSFGRTTQEVSADGSINRYFYDDAGRLYKTIQADGTSDKTASRTQFNAFGEVIGVVSGVGEATISDLDTAIDQYGTSYAYDALGRKIYEENPDGQKTYFYYNADNQLSYVVNALGEVSMFTYTSFGEIATSRQLTNRISIDDLNDNVIADRVNAVKDDASDQVISTYYNSLGLVRKEVDAEGHTTVYFYDKYGNTESVFSPYTDADYRLDTYEYDKLGRLIQSVADVNGVGGVPGSQAKTLIDYDGFGRVERVTDALGNQTHTDYLDNGRRVVVRDALNRSRSTTYDFLGRELVVADAKGQASVYTYDDINRRISVTSPEGITITTLQTRLGQAYQIIDGKGGVTTYRYNKDGDVSSITDAEGNTTINRYDHSGRLYETEDANGHLVRFNYDAVDRMIERQVDPDNLNLRTRYLFDGQGRTVGMLEGYQTDEQRYTQYTFDRNGRITQEIIDPDNLELSTRYSYNLAGNQIKIERGTVSNPSQEVVEFNYDKFGRVVEEVKDPGELHISTQYIYDDVGNLTRTINANGDSTWFVFNDANEMIQQVDALGYVKEFLYDANGKLARTKEYYNPVSVAEIGNPPELVEVISSNNDRITYYVLDATGRQRFTIRAVDNETWQIEENVLDANSNLVESRHYGKYLKTNDINQFTSSNSLEFEVITEAEMISGLHGLGYRDTRWGDNTVDLNGVRRNHFVYDKLSRLRYSIDALDYIAETVFDAVGNIRFQTKFASKILDLNEDYSFENVQSKVVSSSNDRTHEYRFDEADRVIAEITPRDYVDSTYGYQSVAVKNISSYDSLGQVIKRQEGVIEISDTVDYFSDSRTILYSYDKAGRQIKTTLAGWYDTTDKRFYRNKDGQSDRFQRTTEVTYDALGNALMNKIRMGESEYAYQYKIYDGANRKIYDIDAAGYVNGTTYDKQGNKLTEVRFSPNIISYYGSPSPVNGVWSAEEVTDFLTPRSKRVITHAYDKLGRRTVTTLPSVKNYKSSSSTVSANPDSATTYTSSPETRFQYNAFGEVVKTRMRIDSSRWADSYIYYNRIGKQTLTTNPGRYATETRYDAFNNVTRVTEFALAHYGTQTTTIMPHQHTNNRDRIKTFSYDLKGQLLSTTQVNASYLSTYGFSTVGNIALNTSKYNAFGEVIKTSDALGNETSFSYNRFGQVYSVIAPERTIASKDLNPFISQVKVSPRKSYRYNVFGLVTYETRHSTAGRGSYITTQKKYDHIGNQIRFRDGDGFYTHYHVDSNGRTIAQIQHVDTSIDGNTSLGYAHTLERRFAYDIVGRQIATTDVYDNTKQAGSRLYYNAYGEITHEAKIWGSKDSDIKALSRIYAFRRNYDDAGRLISERNQEGYRFYYYDLQGRLTRSEHRGRNNSTNGDRVNEFYYDSLGRAKIERLHQYTGTKVEDRGAIDVALLTPKVLKSYDRWGNITRRTDPLGVATRYAYNYNNQLIHETSAVASIVDKDDFKIHYDAYINYFASYDALGRLRKEAYQAVNTANSSQVDKKVSYQAYDEVGNVTSITDATGKKRNFIYDLHGNKVGTKDGVGNVQVYDYNRRGLVTKHHIYRSVLRVGRLDVLNEYLYDQAGRKYTEWNIARVRKNYEFDERGNIIEKIGKNNLKTRFGFDEFGNKILQENYYLSKNAWVGDRYSYNRSSYRVGELTKRTFVNYVSDSGGIGRTDMNYSYNNFGQLLREESDNGQYYTDYTYWQNGLLRKQDRVDELSGKQRRVTSEYHYDIRGSRTKEYHRTRDDSVRGGLNADINYSMNSVFYYDDLGRLKKIASSGSTFKTRMGSHSSVYVDGLYYEYDAWGNRRDIHSIHRINHHQKGARLIYRYDAEGRVLYEFNTGKETHYTYDNAGRRATAETLKTKTIRRGSSDTANVLAKETYRYNDMGQILDKYENYTYNGDNITKRLELNVYNERGFKVTSYFDKESYIYYDNLAGDITKTETLYRGSGEILRQFNYNDAGGQVSYSSDYSFTGAGDLLGYKYVNGGENVNNTYSYSYTWGYNGSQISQINVKSRKHNGEVREGKTENYYDRYGQLVRAKMTETNPAGDATGDAHRFYAYNADNQVVGSVYYPYDSGAKLQNNYTLNGEVLASIGDERVNVSPINTFKPNDNVIGSYQVKTGDTLNSIAQSVFGDSSLWYVIADANALVMGPSESFSISDVGRSLEIPNSSLTIKNNTSTFKPYNAFEVIGDLTPHPNIPVPPEQNCSVLKQVIVLVVVIVVTYVTAGIATAVLGASSAAAGIAAAAIGGFAGNLAGQQVGVWLGTREKIDFKEAAVSGAVAGAGAATKAVVNDGSSGYGPHVNLGAIGNVVVNSAAKYAANYLAQRIVGIDTQFSMRDFVISALGSIAGEGASALGGDKATSEFVSSAIQSSYNSTANTRINNDKFVADAFGNIIGQGVVDFAASRKMEKQALAAYKLDEEEQARVSVEQRDLYINQKRNLMGLGYSEEGAKEKALKSHAIATSGEFTADDIVNYTKEVINDSKLSKRQKKVINKYIDQYLHVPHIKSVKSGRTKSFIIPSDNIVDIPNVQQDNTPTSTIGHIINDVASPLAFIGQKAIELGKIIDNWWIKYPLMALEIAAGPVAFAAREIFMATPIGKAITDVAGKVMLEATEFVNEEGKLNDMDWSAKAVVGGLSAGALVIGGVSTFRKVIPKAGKFLSDLPRILKARVNYKLELRTETLNSGIPFKLTKKNGSGKEPLLLGTGNPTTKTLNQVKNLRGKKRWQAGEQYIQELYGSDGQRHYRVEGTGGRHVDAPVDTNNGGVLANEVKTYQEWKTVNGQPVQSEVPLSPEIRSQIDKDVLLRQKDPNFDPRWHFLDAPPSIELRQYLNDNKVIHITY